MTTPEEPKMQTAQIIEMKFSHLEARARDAVKARREEYRTCPWREPTIGEIEDSDPFEPDFDTEEEREDYRNYKPFTEEPRKANGLDVPDDEASDTKAVVAELAKLSPLEFDQVCKHQADFLGVQVSTLRSEVKKARGKSKKSESAPAPTTDISHLEMSAGAIIDSDDVLGLFEKAWAKVVAGEQRNAKLLYLVATSRLFDKCMSAAVKGPSSAGKSQIRTKVLDFMPPEDVVAFSTLSEKALLYTEDDFPHKILSMGEAAGAEEQSLQDYLLRELISEGKLHYPVVQKIGNELVTITVEKNGPVCFLVTTTKAALNPENETRMLSLEIDDSGEQTTVVIDKLAETIGLNAESTVINYEPWRDFQRWLAAGNCAVVVPFARELGQLIPPRSVKLRRDFSQILLAIKAHALLHRARRQLDERGQVVADLEQDYCPVAELMGGIVAEASGTSVSKELQQTIDAVQAATAALSADEGATADKIAKLLKLDKSSAWRRLRVAMNKDYIVNLEQRRGQPGRYRLTSQEVEAEAILPSPEAISERMHIPAKTVQPRNRTRNRQPFERLSDCTTGCTVAPFLQDGDPFASMKDPSLKLQPEED